MKNFLKKHQTHFCFYAFAFLTPALIMLVVLWSKDIYWGSKTTILASDGFHQYVIFATQFRNILHGNDSLFYTFTSGLGLNFYALISYYLGSLLTPFYYFFSLKSMADAVYLFTLIKFGLMGLSAALSLGHIHPKVRKSLIISLSTSYALMSFAVSQLEINTWLDVFILVPLIILGLHRLLEFRKFWLYYLTLSLLFIQNYYFGFMTAIFLVLYFLAQLTRDFKWKLALKKFFDFTIVSISSGLTAAIMLLPSYLDLSTHGEEFSKFNTLLTENSWFFDILAKNFVGSYDTTKFGAIPMIYVGLLPLVLALIFFTIKEIKYQVKLAYALLLIIFIASFYLNPLDLLWQGMHSPNMFLHRYAWLLSTLIVFMAAESLSHLKKFHVELLIFCFGLLATGFIITFIYTNHYDFLKPINLILTLSFLLAYFVIFLSFRKNQLSKSAFIIFTLIFSIFELGLNSYYQVTSLDNEWVFPSREGYQRDQIDITKLVDYAKAHNKTFFRTEQMLPQTGNDSMKYNYNGISQFSSIRNTASSSMLDRLGFQSTGTNLNLRYQNNTIIADSLFGLAYNISNEDIGKYGFEQVDTANLLSLYHNSNASQLAILTDEVYKDVNFTVNTLDNQTALLNNLAGLHQQYFTKLSSYSNNNLDTINNRMTLNTSNNTNNTVSYPVKVPANQQVYMSVPDLSLNDGASSNIMVIADHKTYNYTTDNAYSLFNLGYFDKDTTASVTLTFPENNQVSFDRPTFYGLNTEAYQKAMDVINNKKVTVTTRHNKVTANYSAEKDGSLFFTIPYDKGWKASVNGEKVKIRKGQKGFLVVDVPAGKGTVQLDFVPKGFKVASLISLSGLLLFVSYTYSCHHLFKKK
ncbi:YfhO family protein [Streptococcus dentapri]|uniref:YfhO family protein n=1 Tax=Streptococcus dentapri TaxID=573564 RepID=A0ABV8D1S1_9STRE